jgi:hypothetical protein
MNRLAPALTLALLTACHDDARPRAADAIGLKTEPLAPPATPAALRVPDDQKLVLRATATGVQIYTCALKSNALAEKDSPSQKPPEPRFEWTLKAPEANLFDAAGKVIGRHYAGPTWESIDGSQVVGQRRASVEAPGAIAWLLLEAKSNAGHGVLAKVKSVQRLETKGGEAPANGCDAAHAGAESKVEYGATYYFYD